MKNILGFILFGISVFLLAFTGPIGLLYGVLHLFLTLSGKKLNHYFWRLAVAIDQLGNVVMQHLFNDILIQKNGYLFGHEDETISSVLGKNERDKTLAPVGKFVTWILNKLDENHALNSIESGIQNSVIESGRYVASKALK